MKRELPIAVAFVVGVLMIVSFFFTSKPLSNAAEIVQDWGVIVSAFALGLASVNLIQIHAKKIARGKGLDWLYSGSLIVSMIGMALLGIIKGPTHKTYQFWFDALFVPGQATVYAMTGFFIASAAYRAFRVRNVDAAILLVSAAILMLANVPIGERLWSQLPAVGDWLMDVPNLAGQRGMLIGAGIGGIASGLRVLLGIERSYLGGSSS
ncbi:MAG: hypothetical protein IMF26_09700 [Candidatus Fermentithermobacillus carboniphilus]|uniref:Uncharacterized protein n=1 Tax=Candidatus Fermentithermobacillus carboniphilus TaxID=3085328 RepID=A0AAT9LB41_9FIRM|nr:MAG: hypothetical protein IMF26_09700 [Candidatus Fermentithermobacillus carboniphilus]